MRDLEQALGQFVLYRVVLAQRDPDRILYLAVPDDILRGIFEEPLGALLFENHLVQVLDLIPRRR